MEGSGHIHIIGAGVAGLACAAQLAAGGAAVTLYESAPQAGGRCRSRQDDALGRMVDNGTHLLLSANRTMLELIELIGARGSFTRYLGKYYFVDLKSGQRWEIVPPLQLGGGDPFDYFRAMPLLFAGRQQTVAKATGKYSALYRRFIKPVTLAMLNTHPKSASARLLRDTLKAIYRAGKDGSDYYLPKESWSESLIAPLVAFITQHGGKIFYAQTLQEIVRRDNVISQLHIGDHVIEMRKEDAVVLAVPFKALHKLLPEITCPTRSHGIINGHFAWNGTPALPEEAPLLGVTGGLAQWIWQRDGLISTTSSGANFPAALQESSGEEIAQLLWNDVCQALGLFDAPLPAYRLINEKQATMQATPEQLALRPACATDWKNLFLAGDYVDTGLPTTLESAALSGKMAADSVTRYLSSL